MHASYKYTAGRAIALFFVLFTPGFSGLKAQEVLVPEWAKSAIWYQIFPERFRNGDTSNDPTLQDIMGCWPHDSITPWQLSSWTSDWYEKQPWEQEAPYDMGGIITRRRYGGDIQGMLDELAYIKSLGVNAIYLNPVFWAPSLHKYDAIMYHHIDPHFGPDPEGDKAIIATEDPLDPRTWKWTSADRLMLEFIQACHQRHIRVIFDGVFNHMGIRSFAFQDVLKNQQNSPYKDWFTIYSWDTDTSAFSYQGWFGVPDLPEIREDEHGIVNGPKSYIYNCTSRWMMPNGNVANGIDGWRLDVAFCVDHAFWKDWRMLVKAINPDAYLTAEVVDKIEVVSPYLEGDEFDAVMNYGFGVVASEFFINRDRQISVTEFDKRLTELRNAFPADITYVQQNLFDSHDTQRFTSYIVNHDVAYFRDWGDYFNKTRANNPAYDERKPTKEEYRIQKLMALFQFTYVGAPMVYYGDEVGMWGANDPDCRKPMVWDDLTYDDEVYNADGSTRKPDQVLPNMEMHDWYVSIARLRGAYKVFSLGSFETLLTDDENGVYVYRRRLEGEPDAVVILNNSEQDQKSDISQWLKGTVYNPMKKVEQYFPSKDPMVTVPYKSGLVLMSYTK
ncbi:MAG: glycoside hydrolase family 13 protein [Chitinophagales bacterium]|nr:glycoside hydrolase family 13 protein [Chitinophagales bacterium]